MGRIPEKIIEKIIQSNDIVDVISEFVSLKHSGRNYMGVCPFHGDKGPSLSVSKEKQLYHCFGCGASGNSVGFIMKLRNIDFPDAIQFLAERVGIKLEFESSDPRVIQEEKNKESMYKINIEAARFFFSNLNKDIKSINYLKDRGISEKTFKKFGLGYSNPSWDSLYYHLKSKGYSDDSIFKAGLILKKNNGGYYDRFRNRLMFPVFDIKGRVIGFGGRVFDDSKPKYLNSPETPVFIKGTNLYGLNFLIKSGIPEYILIVEGYMDCISLHQSGITNVVASLGTALTNDQAKLLKRYSKNIFICYDSDAAGQAATLRGLEILNSVGCEVKVITISDGKDPDEYIKLHGVDEFKKLINNAELLIDYKIKMAQKDKNIKDANDKSLFVSNVAGILSKIDSEIMVQAYAAKVYDQTGINVNAILDEVGKIKKNNLDKENNKSDIRYNNTSGNFYNLEPAYKKAERWLIKFSIMNADFYNYIKEKIKLEDFITEIYRTAYSYVIKMIEKNKEVDANSLLINYESQDDINDISLIFNDNKYNNGGFEIIDDFIKTIKKYNFENKINEITLQIKKCEENNEIVKSAALSQELITLQKQLNML